MEEKDTWQEFLEGSKKALSEIFLNYHDDLFRYGKRLTSHNEIVKDCIQDLFLRLWKNRNNLKYVQQIKPYLLKSLRNHLIDSLEFLKPYTPLDIESDSSFIVNFSTEDFLPDERVDEEKRLKVVQSLNKLTPRQREIIYLRYFEELDFTTIAHVMGMNIQSVRNVIFRGMQTLRDLLVIQLFIMLLSKQELTLPG